MCAGGFESGFRAPVSRMGAAGGGQTREHAQLAKSLGVDQLAVVVTKLDTCDYDTDRFQHIKCAESSPPPPHSQYATMAAALEVGGKGGGGGIPTA